jgi:hypothetical protein
MIMNKTVRTELRTHEAFCHEQVVSYGDYQTCVCGDSFSIKIALTKGGMAKGGLFVQSVVMLTGKDGLVEARDFEAETIVGEDYISVSGLPLVPPYGSFELIVRPYAIAEDGIRRYAKAFVFYYDGQTDKEGNPIPVAGDKKTCVVTVSDDAYIFNCDEQGLSTVNFGSSSMLQVRNTGDENTDLYRAAYFKFTLDSEMMQLVDTVASAKLRIFVRRTEDNPARKFYGLRVYGTKADWDEKTLTYANHATLATTIEPLSDLIHCEQGYMKVEVLPYIKKQPRNADGSVTVSFCVTGDGHEDEILVYICSKEDRFGTPIIDLGYHNTIDFNMPTKENVGFEPWGYAKMIVDEWFTELRDKIYPKDENGNLIYHELEDFAPEGYNATEPTGDFTRKIEWRHGSRWTMDGIAAPETWKKEKYVRTISTLGTAKGKPFEESEYAAQKTEYDEYGGITNAGFTGKKTGFFHTEKHGGRTYIIDPLGNPYFAMGVNTTCLGDDDNHKQYSLEKYGTEENYYKEISASLKGMGISINHLGQNAPLLAQENGLANVIGISVVGAYMRTLGRSQVSEGVYPHNNTINLFDPDFVKSAYQSASDRILGGGFADNPRVFGYTTDNEQPSGPDILDRYLGLDTSEPTNAFSYAVAWTWLAARMNVPIATLDALHASSEYKQINSEFLGFMYGRYGKVTREAVEAVDKNHMLLGSRVNGNCPSDEGYLRAAGYYLDIITTNLYGGLNPKAETIVNLYRYSGKPFIVTEFYAKALDAVDANGYLLGNSTGAGQLVETQQDRADYYEHYALALLQSKACVGWTWYRYRDNDQGLFRKKGTDNVMYMACVTYGGNRHVNTFMDENGKILTVGEVGEFEEIYHGEPMASNQNANKGIYASRFWSLVSVYRYDKDGKLVDFMGYEVKKPESETPEDGTVLVSPKGDKTYTIGEVKNADGGVTKTILTVYEGKYVALARSISRVSKNMLGLLKYFDQ